MQFDPFCQFISLFSSPTLNLPVQLIWCCNTIWNCHKLKSWREFTFALVLLHRKSAAKSFRRSCFMRLEIIWKCNWYTQKGFIDYGVWETQIEDHGEHGKDIKHGDILQFSKRGVLHFFNYHVLQLRCSQVLQLRCSLNLCWREAKISIIRLRSLKKLSCNLVEYGFPVECQQTYRALYLNILNIILLTGKQKKYPHFCSCVALVIYNHWRSPIIMNQLN